MARYSILLEQDPDDGGYTVTVPALPGIVTEGDTFEDALAMAREAIQLHIYGLQQHRMEVQVESIPYLLVSVEVDTDRAALEAFMQRAGTSATVAN